MKNKRTFVGLFVILALLCLGIGYAAVTKTLTINGGISTGDEEALKENFVVYFSAVSKETTNAQGATVTANVDAAAKATSTSFSVSNMNVVGSSVVLTYTIKNDSTDLYAFVDKVRIGITEGGVENITDTTSGTPIKIGENGRGVGYFNVTTEWLMGAQLDPNGGTTTLVIRIEMTSTPINVVDYNFTIYFDCRANTFGATS